jgi:hypothetical protein
MSVLDTQILSEIQSHLVEPENAGASYASGFWTAAEVLDYLNGRQYQFLRETLVLLGPATLATTPNVLRHPLPQGWIATYDVQWHDADGGWKELPPADSYSADHAIPTWDFEQAPAPQVHSDGDQQTLTIQVAPAPSDAGLLEILYAQLSTLLTGAGVALEVPDEFAPAIKWGVIADMLSKVGRAMDPERSAYAEARYAEGVEAARVMLRVFL